MPQRVLIVEDHKEVSRLLRSALETIERGLEVHEAPSGEEALLEATRTTFDLLVADYRLPGMNGLELMQKIRSLNSQVKVILISGVTDAKMRGEVVNSNADAFFLKPVPIGGFLSTVEGLLSMEKTVLPPFSEQVESKSRKNLADMLANLRKEVEAESVILLSSSGGLLAQAGELPALAAEPSYATALLSLCNAGIKIFPLTGNPFATGVHIFSGGQIDLMVASVGLTNALLVAGKDLTKGAKLSKKSETVKATCSEVFLLLQSIGGTGALAPEVVEAHEASLNTHENLEEVANRAETEELNPAEFDALFSNASGAKTDVNAFWEEAVESGPAFSLKDTLSFDEASKLGLAPEADE